MTFKIHPAQCVYPFMHRAWLTPECMEGPKDTPHVPIDVPASHRSRDADPVPRPWHRSETIRRLP